MENSRHPLTDPIDPARPMPPDQNRYLCTPVRPPKTYDIHWPSIITFALVAANSPFQGPYPSNLSLPSQPAQILRASLSLLGIPLPPDAARMDHPFPSFSYNYMLPLVMMFCASTRLYKQSSSKLVKIRYSCSPRHCLLCLPSSL